MEKKPSSSDIQLPPGFRFHPSDEELIVHYLRKKVTSNPLPASIIADIDLYKYNPWDLPNNWVLCRVRQKNGNPRNTWDDHNCPTHETTGFLPKLNELWPLNTNPNNIEIAKSFLYNDCPMLPYIFASQDLFPCIDTASSITFQDNNNGHRKDNLMFSISSLDRSLKRKYNTESRNQRENDYVQVPVPPSKKITVAEEIVISSSAINNEYEGTSTTTTTTTDHSDSNNLGHDHHQWSTVMQYQELNNLAFSESDDQYSR
ncbi:hypothetical protein EZV62_016349 [Acer yangbiense]|uniref:NAC domain-containing protein n=1 Tax=Acer yangbiense TaxID=1000413 RepID=A0A5C7HN87_9ROSI|nr:hypothetical protein EZV62_016349 [Acer yangbiense]